MRKAETVLGIIRDRGSRGLPLEDVYRQLFNPQLFLVAYGKISANQGALTPGITQETADGMDLKRIQQIIDALKAERYRWKPVRRTYVEKKGSAKKRPLGIPTWSDKLLQEVVRLILEAYYEPQFSPRSHGFRPGRGCHTALSEIYHRWRGTTWFIEGDISACFDSLSHEVLVSILAEKIHDNRFLRLIRNLLRAGYLEDWRFNKTFSGTPQGGIASPVLSNIYLDRLDKFIENVLIPEYTRGVRKPSATYRYLAHKYEEAKRRGRPAEAKELRRRLQSIPSCDVYDPMYRKLRYLRYADDFLLGFTGPRTEAEEIKRRIRDYLREPLKLELSDAKTLVTHGRTGTARFLGYDVVVMHDNTQRTGGKRSINGVVGLKVPMRVVQEKCAPYMAHGKPIHRTERTNDTVFSIIARFEAEYRGVVEYYRMAFNLHQFDRLKWIMEQSLTKTLAAKLRLSVHKVYRRYRATVQTERGSRKILRTTLERSEKKPLVATWGRTDLVRRTEVVLNDAPKPIQNRRVEIVERLLAETCELCGSQHNVEVHHIHHLKDLKRPGRAEKPRWVQKMAARRRKKLVVCHVCHVDIHQGRLGNRVNRKPLESRVR